MKKTGGVKMAEDKVKEGAKVEAAPQPPMQPPKDQLLAMAFQSRLNALVQEMNDLFRDVKEIMNQK